jgi:ABC-2 type transport system permease protein
VLDRQALVVARREFFERVRTRWFAVVTLLGPLAMVALIVIPVWLQVRSAEEGVRIKVVDRTPEQVHRYLQTEGSDVVHPLFKELAPPETTEAELEALIRDEQIDGYLILPADLLSGGEARYRGDNATNMGLVKVIKEAVRLMVFRARAKSYRLDDMQIELLFKDVKFDSKQTTGRGEAKSGAGSFFIGYAVMFVLYMAIILYAVSVLRSVVLEKTNRVVELVVSALKPQSLMLGKVLGAGLVGVVQLGVWAGMALLLFQFKSEVLGIFGLPDLSVISFPSLHLADILVIILYFLLGFFFYAALYAAIGAIVNSEQEAQQAQTPLMLLIMIPAVCVQIVANDPRGPVAAALTQIPFSSPVLMPMRYFLGAVSAAELLLSMALLFVALLGSVWVAGKVYRVGILMYGKRPSLAEIWRWIRE